MFETIAHDQTFVKHPDKQGFNQTCPSVTQQTTGLHDLAFLNKLALDSGFQIFQV